MAVDAPSILSQWKLYSRHFHKTASLFLTLSGVESLPAKAFILTVILKNSNGTIAQEKLDNFPIASAEAIEGLMYKYIDSRNERLAHLYKACDISLPATVDHAILQLRKWNGKALKPQHVNLFYAVENDLYDGTILSQVGKISIAEGASYV